LKLKSYELCAVCKNISRNNAFIIWFVLLNVLAYSAVVLNGCFCLLAVCVCTVETVDKQRVLAVCCSDSNNDSHVAVVRNFLKFLEAKCNMSVIVIDNNCPMSAESVQDWLLEEINLAKKVVLFHSEESIAMAYHFTKFAVIPSVALRTFITALEMFSQSKVDQSKLVNVYFSYTPFSYVVNVNCGHTYQLMSEFDMFLTNVRGSSGFNSNSLLACDEGRKLQCAINKAAADAEAYPSIALSGFLPPDGDTDSIDTQSLASRIAANGGSSLLDF